MLNEYLEKFKVYENNPLKKNSTQEKVSRKNSGDKGGGGWGGVKNGKLTTSFLGGGHSKVDMGRYEGGRGSKKAKFWRRRLWTAP